MKDDKFILSNLAPVVYVDVDNKYQYSIIVSMLMRVYNPFGTLIGMNESKAMYFVVNSQDNNFWDTDSYSTHKPLIHAADFIESNMDLAPADYDATLAFPEQIESDMCYFLSVDESGVKLAEVCLNKTKETYKLALSLAYLIIRGNIVEVYNHKNAKIKTYPREKCLIK